MTRHRKVGNEIQNNTNHNTRKEKSKEELWKGALEKDIGNNVIIQMVGMDSSSHTVYARVNPTSGSPPEEAKVQPSAEAVAIPLGKVIEVMVDEGWRHVARSILEKKIHIEPDSYPSANELLKLGAVWLLNETAYANGDHAHARRLSEKDEKDTPSWEDMTLRVHYVPDRFHVAHEVDWTKYCRGLLLDNSVTAFIGKSKAHVPMAGLPDKKDGVIVYENNDVGFAILNKPGGMPSHSTLSNHAEDVVSMYSSALKERHHPNHSTNEGIDEATKAPFVSLPIKVESEMHGLLLVATKKEFYNYMTRQQNDPSPSSPEASSSSSPPSSPSSPSRNGNHNHPSNANGGSAVPSAANTSSTPPPVKKMYRCLVCIKQPDDIDRIQKMVNKTIEHYIDPKSPSPKRFVRHKPKSANHNNNNSNHHHHHEWHKCLMRITNIGNNTKFRAACVSSKYSDSNDFTLAHRLWGPNSDHPAEELGVTYVMQLDVQLLNHVKSSHQLRGQLAALGCPIVGDKMYGGGVCEMRAHRHLWQRMAVQCCRMEFMLPQWEMENDDKKKVLVKPKDNDRNSKCIFSLNKAWWTDYLIDYERYL